MKLFYINPNLDNYGTFRWHNLEQMLPLKEYQLYGDDGLGKQWSEYVILVMSTVGVPSVLETIHKQAPLRKNIQLNKRKSPCLNKPTPPSDQSPSLLASQPFSIQPLQATLNDWLNGSTAPSPNINGETASSGVFQYSVDTLSAVESF